MKKSFLFLILIGILSCTNFNAYFNTFYNAKKLYKEASDIPRRDNGRASSNAISKYNQVIKKCGIILTDYKDSKYTDDALMLMGKAFYYKGRGYVQAIEKFQELIKFYPESEFYKEAHLYLAKCRYKMNKKQDAIADLKKILSKPDFKEIHPNALLTLAEYYEAEENYLQAEYNLTRIVDNFPKSKQYETAFFNLGKLYWQEEKFQRSRDTFQALKDSKVSKRTKLNARYYVTLNDLELGNYKKALRESRVLLKDEVKADKFPTIELMEARSLANLQKTDEAAKLFQKIVDENKRTEVAAQAYFYWGEMHFQITHDYETAIEKYNKVQNQKRNSDFVEKAVSKSAVASQIIQYYHPDSSLDIETLVDQQFKLAEFYLQNLQQPDSALVVYDDIIERKDLVKTEIDTLKSDLDSLYQAHSDIIDKLTTPDSTSISDSVTTATVDSVFLPLLADSTITTADSSFGLPGTDSLQIAKLDTIQTDSLTIAPDSVATRNTFADSLLSLYTQLKQKIARKEKEYDIYQNICIPHANFLKVWIYDQVKQDSLVADSLASLLQKNYPDNKYTLACRQLLNDEKIEFETEEKKHLQTYTKAIEFLDTHPQKSVDLLEVISKDSTNTYHHKALYALGYIHYFVLEDSVAAKSYWQQILAYDNSDFQSQVKNFFDGNNFIKINRLEAISKAMEAEEASVQDSLTAIQDSIDSELTTSDSLKFLPDSLSAEQPDSLSTLSPALADSLTKPETTSTDSIAKPDSLTKDE